MKTCYKNIIFIFIPVLLGCLLLIFANSYSLIFTSDTEECFSCHEDKELEMEINGKKVSVYVDPSEYKKSVHKKEDCKNCHLNYDPAELPHVKTRQDVNCTDCHDQSKNTGKNVHYNVKCYECHTKHNIKPANELKDKQSDACLKCHNTQSVKHYSQSIHAKNKVSCESCHNGGHDVKNITKSEITSICGKCHGEHEKNYNNSIHKTVLKSGNRNAPSCTDCHGSHKIIRGKISVESESCLNCHLDENKFPGEQQGSAKFVQHYKTSIHASIEKEGLLEAAGCVDCHGNHMIQNLDNPKASTSRAKLIETCGKCHLDVVDKFKKSKHGQELETGNELAPTCTDCHGEHYIQSTSLSNDFSKINLSEKCLGCHINGKIPHKNFKGEEELISGYRNSVHYSALKDGNFDAPTCYECHGAHEMEYADSLNSKISKKNIAMTCGQANCHKQQLINYTGSIHEKGVSEGNMDSPTCNNCHGNHGIVTKNIESKVEKSRELVNLCSNCHSSVELVERNDLPTKVTQTYSESFHGLATRGGSTEAANCESCHGNHNIRPSTDSLSTINKKNLPETCGKCHPGATEVLFTKKIHLTNPEEDSPWVFWITRFYLFMIFGVIGFMLFHNLLDYRKKIQMKVKSKELKRK